MLLASTPAWAGELAVVSVSPARHSLLGRVDTTLAVTFDQAVDPASIAAGSFWAFGRWSGTVGGASTRGCAALGGGGGEEIVGVEFVRRQVGLETWPRPVEARRDEAGDL